MGSLFRYVLGLALVVSCELPAAAAQERCSSDALLVDGSAVAAKFCVAAPAGGSVSVTETFVTGTKSLTRVTALSVVSGADVSRTLDDVDLSPLGVRRTLHMTLAYRRGSVVLEHALALPGATPVK